MNDRSSLRALLLCGFSFLAVACGDDGGASGEGEPSQIDGGGGGDVGAMTRVDAGPRMGDAGKPSSGGSAAGKGSCAAAPANAVGGKFYFTCGYVCKLGFADCDGLRENGCELDLKEPNACSRCGPAACLNHTMCGLEAPVCQKHVGEKWTAAGDMENQLGFAEFGSVAAGPKDNQVFAAMSMRFDRKLPSPGVVPPSGSLSEFSLEPGNVRPAWSAGSPFIKRTRMWRFGERLYVYREESDILDKSVTLVVSDLAGAKVWSKNIEVKGATFCPAALAVDESNNVFLGLRLCDGEFEFNGQTHEAFKYGSDGVEMLVVSFDAAGNERWRAMPHDASRGACWLGGRSAVLSMIAVNGKLLQLNRKCLMEVDPATGAALQDHPLYLPNDWSKVAADAAGNLYVGGLTTDNFQLFLADGADTWNEKDWLGLPGRVFVSKYSPTFEHLWTRPVAIRNKAEFLDFDVSPSGKGQLVGHWGGNESSSGSFVFDFDADGRTLGAEILSKPWLPVSVSLSDEGTPYIGGTIKNDPSLGSGLFVGRFSLQAP
jgi:hypothetical protein